MVNNNINDMKLFPGQKMVLSFGVIIPEILKNYEQKSILIEYSYSKINSSKQYNESTNIDFEQYSRFLVYISEINELQQKIENQNRSIKTIEKEVKKFYPKIVQYINLNERIINTVVDGYEIQDK